MKAKNSEHDQSPERTEARFPYSLELVASIAARFTKDKADDRAAAYRAIQLLEATQSVIDLKEEALRTVHGRKQRAEDLPERADFEKGIRLITWATSTTKALHDFRRYLRINLRLCAIGNPPQLDDEAVRHVVEDSGVGERPDEDEKIERLISEYRKTGFRRHELAEIRRVWGDYKTRIKIPFQNREKGKKGGRPKKSK